MCTNSRPSDYQIPENYEMSPKEIDWRKMENDAHKQVSLYLMQIIFPL